VPPLSTRPPAHRPWKHREPRWVCTGCPLLRVSHRSHEFLGQRAQFGGGPGAPIEQPPPEPVVDHGGGATFESDGLECDLPGRLPGFLRTEGLPAHFEKKTVPRSPSSGPRPRRLTEQSRSAGRRRAIKATRQAIQSPQQPEPTVTVRHHTVTPPTRFTPATPEKPRRRRAPRPHRAPARTNRRREDRARSRRRPSSSADCKNSSSHGSGRWRTGLRPRRSSRPHQTRRRWSPAHGQGSRSGRRFLSNLRPSRTRTLDYESAGHLAGAQVEGDRLRTHLGIADPLVSRSVASISRCGSRLRHLSGVSTG
jgi:hypothetical protein